jgi:predicted RNase H-like nuclease
VNNATSNWPCERHIGRYFGRYQAFSRSANTSNTHFAGRPRALRIAQALNLAVDPNSSAQCWRRTTTAATPYRISPNN